MVSDVAKVDADKLVAEGRKTKPVMGDNRYLPWSKGPFPFYRETAPDKLGFDVLDQMRGYGTIKAALTLITYPILAQAKQAQAVSNDEDRRNYVQERFVDNGLLFRIFRTSLRALWAGIAPHELIFEVQDLNITYEVKNEDGTTSEEQAWSGPAIIIKEAKEVNPRSIAYIMRRAKDRDGKKGDWSYDGFVQKSGEDTFDNPNSGSSEQGIWIEATKSFVYAHDIEYDNLWGRPRILDAYPYYFWAQYIWKFWMGWAEKKLAATRVGYAPPGEDSDGNDNLEGMLNLINSLDGVQGIVLPSTDEEGSEAQSKWRIDELKVTDRTDTFSRVIDALDLHMLRSMFVPERVFIEGKYGTKAEAEAHTDTFMQTLDATQDDIEDGVNQFIVAREVAINFGDGEPVYVKLPGLTDEQRAIMRSTFQAMLNNMENQAKINFEALVEMMGLPLAEVEEVASDDTLEEDLAVEDELLAIDDATADDELAATEEELDADLAATPPTEPPSNLLLSDDDALLWFYDMEPDKVINLSDVARLAEVDLTKYEMIPDANSRLGFKVINKLTGRRVLGNAAANVVKSFQNKDKKAAKKAETEAAKAKRKQESEAKKAAARAAAEARKQQRAAEKAQRDAVRAGTKAAKDAARDAAKKAREAQAAARKADAEAKRAARQQEAERKKAEREGAKAARDAERTRKQQEREGAKADRERQREETRVTKEQISNAKAERTTIESQTKTADDPDKALDTIKRNGWDADGDLDDNQQDAIDRAEAIARDNPDKIVTVVKVGDTFQVITKPKNKLQAKARLGGTAGLDDPPVDDEPGYYGGEPTTETSALWELAQQRIRGLLNPDRPIEEDDDATED